ncbi:MAG: pyridoxamine 5'-phosphate oxidase family protein [Clostridiales bacterium]|nr:pyridoxamine 5'-phosphate oxidase family protein [Clostridiales bacterium]
MKNKQMSIDDLKDHIVDFLKDRSQGSLATCADHIPRSSPVRYYLGNNMNIYILSAGGEKFNTIDRNPKVCLLVNTDYIDFRQIKGVQIFGKAVTSLQKPHLFNEAQQQCRELNEKAAQLHDLMVIKVIPEEVVYLNSLGDGDRTKQFLKLDKVVEESDEYRSTKKL